MSRRSDQIGKHDSKNNAAATEAWAKEGTIVGGRNNFPKLHNAMWPGVVGKGPDSEPPIGLDEMLDLTAYGIEDAHGRAAALDQRFPRRSK